MLNHEVQNPYTEGENTVFSGVFVSLVKSRSAVRFR